jgi:hypothetical protein
MGFALEVEKRFDRKLAQFCRDNGGKFRFVNAGVDGWGTVQASRYAEDHFDALRPDIIVLTFCENDPYDDESFLADEGPTRTETRPARLFLQKHCHLYRLFYNLRWMWQNRDEVRQLGRDQKTDGKEDPAAAIAIPEELWGKSLQRIRDFHAAFLKFNPNGALLLQATSPTSTDMSIHLSQLDNDKNLLYVDLGGQVSNLPLTERRLPHDPHWSEKVQEISARALYDKIIAL